MYFYIILVNVLFIPIINGGNSTLIKVKDYTTTTALPLEDTKLKTNLAPNVPIVSEGGSILPSVNTPSLVSGEQNNSLLQLDMEMGKDKVKPIARRKGVNIKDFEEIAPESSAGKLAPTNDLVKNLSENPKTNLTTELLPVNTGDKLLNNTGNNTESKTEVHKKPLILSYEALANMDHIENKLPEIKSSSRTFPDQLSSPNKEPVFQRASNTNKHPGMIMPVVITILVVPMFAVLGYMALKRGREAWQNRHYKRMDFLLDGMYND